MALSIASYKLQFHEGRVRAVPERDAQGCAFKGPGVDVRGERASAILAAAGPVRQWLLEREPGIVLRSLSVDLKKGRVLITLEPDATYGMGERPRVLRFDSPSADDLIAAGRDVERLVSEACVMALEARATRGRA